MAIAHILTRNVPSTHKYASSTPANTPAHYLLTYGPWSKPTGTHNKKHTHTVGGKWMSTNGLAGPSGMVWYGGA